MTVLSGGVSQISFPKVNWSKLGSFGKGLLGALPTIASSAASVAGLFGKSGGTSVWKSMKLQEHQEALQERYLRNYYTNARQSLESAGYNPMLAYMNSIGGGSASAMATDGNEVGQRASAMQNLLQNRVLGSQIANTNANTAKQIAEAQTESMRPALIESETRLNIAKEILTSKTASNYEKQLASQILLNERLGSSSVTNASVGQASFGLDKEVQGILRDKEKRYKEFGEHHPALRNIDETITRYFNGANFSASGSLSKKFK